MGHLAEVEHEYLIRDGLADGYRQLVGALLELAAVDDRVHRHHLWIGIGNLYTDGALAGYGGDDTGAEGGKRQGDVVFEVLDLRDAHARGRGDLVERDGGAHGGLDGGYLDAEVAQRLDDAIFLGILLVAVDKESIIVALVEQVDGGVFVA